MVDACWSFWNCVCALFNWGVCTILVAAVIEAVHLSPVVRDLVAARLMAHVPKKEKNQMVR